MSFEHEVLETMTGFTENTSDKTTGLGEVLFEFVTIGNAVKVSALHVASNIEVSLVGSPNMTPYTLKANAVRKLRAALARSS